VTQRALRRGTLVEVRSPTEILATLDANGELESLPFMPEMLAYTGRRFVVDARTEKICDTVHGTGSRRLKDTVLLADLRCDGAAHGGCEAECRLLWKQAWLRRVGPADAPAPEDPAAERVKALLAVQASRTVEVAGGSEQRYSCQATALFRASKPLGSAFNPIPYVREFTCGNVSFWKFLRVSARAAVEHGLNYFHRMPEIHVPGTRAKPVVREPLNVVPGEWVQVRSREKIAETLSQKGRNRGLWFDREMVPYCGGMYRVRRRVSRLIEEGTGKMIVLKNDCVSLEGVVCSGERSLGRYFCARKLFPLWRECWLERVPEPPPGAAPATSQVDRLR
jgi:hypothetical protein